MNPTTQQILDLADVYEEQFESGLRFSLVELETFTEAPAILTKIKTFFTRVIMFFDTFLQNIAAVYKRYIRMQNLGMWYAQWQQVSESMPKEMKKAFVEYHMSWTLESKEADFYYNMARNLSVLFQYKYSVPEAYELYKALYIKRAAFTSQADKNDTLYKVPFKGLIGSIEQAYHDYNTEFDEIRHSLLSFSKTYAQSKERSFDESFFYQFFHGIASAIKMKTIAMMYNVSSYCTGVGEISKEFITNDLAKRYRNFEKMSSDPKREKEFRALLKNSKYITSYDFGGHEIKVWQFPIDGPSCFNMEGYDIYVDASFFKYSRPLQKAIIYHEIGHLASGHFQTFKTPNLEKRMQQIIRDYNKFVDFKNYRAKFVHEDDELIYLLDELEADRYSAKRVGKHTVKKSLTYSFDRSLHMNPKDVNHPTEKEALLIAYNKERMKLRRYLM